MQLDAVVLPQADVVSHVEMFRPRETVKVDRPSQQTRQSHRRPHLSVVQRQDTPHRAQGLCHHAVQRVD